MNAVPAGLNQSLGSALTRAVSETSGPGIASRIAEITRTAPQPSSAITFARRRKRAPIGRGRCYLAKSCIASSAKIPSVILTGAKGALAAISALEVIILIYLGSQFPAQCDISWKLCPLRRWLATVRHYLETRPPV